MTSDSARRFSLRPLWIFSLQRPPLVIAIGALLLGWLALEARHLRFEHHVDLLSPDDPVSVAERERQDRFGSDFRILVALAKSRREGGVLTPTSLEALEELHGELAALPEVRRIASLVNVRTLVSSPWAPEGARLWAGSETGSGELLLRRLERSPLLRRMLLSRGNSLTPLYLEFRDQTAEPELARRIVRLAAELEGRYPEGGDVLVVGPALVQTSLAEHVLDDLFLLVPISVSVMLLLLLAVFRSAAVLVVVLGHTSALLVIVLGGMAVLGLGINLVSVLAPILLVPIGAADLLHLLVRLRSVADREARPVERLPILDGTFARLEGAMVGTSITTAIGFLAFLLSPVPAIRQFGTTLSAGVAVALLISLTLDAALLSLVWRLPRSSRIREARRAPLAEGWLSGLGGSNDTLRRRSRRAVLICLYLAVPGLISLFYLRIDDTWVGNFDPGSSVAQDARHFEDEFVGTNILSVVIESDPSTPGARHRALELASRLPDMLVPVPAVRGAVSLETLARMLHPPQGGTSSPPAAPTLEAMLEGYGEWKRRGLPLPRAEMLATPDLSSFQVLAFVVNDHYWELGRSISRIRARAEESAGSGVTVRMGGDLVRNMRMVRLAVVGQSFSIAVLLAVIAVLVIGYTRSLRSGMTILAPMGLAILAAYFIVVNLGIPYGIAVSIFPTLMIGLAVDFAIHVRAALARNREASPGVWTKDMVVVVNGIVLNGLLWGLGFAVLAFSRIPPDRYLGLLCSAVVWFATAVTLLLVPTSTLAMSRERERGGGEPAPLRPSAPSSGAHSGS